MRSPPRPPDGGGAWADIIVRRFGSRLIALAGTRLGPALRSKVDPEDVVQSVFKSYFARQAAGQSDPDSWDELWSLLVLLTVRKCCRQVRRFRSARRDMTREVRGQRNDDAALPGALDRDPTPAEATALAELVELLAAELKPHERPILDLRLQGYTVEDLAAGAGCSQRTAYRVLAQVRGHLQQLLEDAE